MELTLPVAAAVLGAALLHAAWNTLVKSSEDKELDTVAIAAGCGLIAVVVASLPADARAGIVAVARRLGGGAHPLLRVPRRRLSLRGALVRVSDHAGRRADDRGGERAAVFAEALSGGQWLGVLLVCGGIVAFASGAHDRRATLFALANAVVIGAYTLIDAQGVRASAAPASYTLWFFAANALVIIAMGRLERGGARSTLPRRHWRRALLGGACSVGSYGIALWAMTRAPVALVAVMRETAVIFGAVLAALVLKEKLTRRRLFATGAVLAGLILLRI